MTKENFKGSLYVFEGPDGTGKTTLSNAFSNYLSSTGHKCSYFSFPGNCTGTLGKHIYEIHHELNDLGINSINSTSLQLLHVASHIDAIECEILPKLRKGHSIVLDRFWWSTIVYGTVSGANKSSLKKLIEIERIHWDNIKPECIFYMNRLKTLKADSNKNWNELVSEYNKLSEQESSYCKVARILNETSPEDALSQIISVYSKLLKGNL